MSAKKTITTILLTILLFSMIPFSTAQEEFEWNRQIPFVGAQPTLVLLVQFSDVKMRISTAQAEQIVKGVDDFIRTASYGRTWLEYTIHPRVLTLPKPMAYYGAPSQGAQEGDDPSRIIEYHVTTIRLAKQEGIDLTNYKHIIIIHAGKNEAVFGSANDIWSHCYFSKEEYFLIERYGFDKVEADYRKNPQTQWLVEFFMHRKRDGRGHLIAGIETVAEEDFPAYVAHEFTHSMWIFDHYVFGKHGYSIGSEVGVWTNMDYGNFLDPPVDIDGWSKYLLGWIEAVTVERDGEYIIHTLDNPEEPHGLIIPINNREYYFIHARRTVGQDAALPGPGVLVFRVDKYKYRNVEGEPFMVQLYDAHPTTPPECETFSKEYSYPEFFMSQCVKYDAPFYAQTGYRNMWMTKYFDGNTEGPFTISLQNSEFVTEEGFRIEVMSFDQGAGVARVRISLRGDRGDGGGTTTVTRTVTGTATETLYTTTTVVGTETRTVVVTVATTRQPPDTGEQYTSLAIILAALIIALSMAASVRRRAPPPP